MRIASSPQRLPCDERGMTRWPWVTAIVAGLLAISPIARDIFDAAFVSSERWMQDFWRCVFLCGVAILLVLAFIEWGIRVIILRRRAAVAGSCEVQNTET